MILDTLSCFARENASQAYHIHKEAEHGDSGRAYLSLLAQQVTTLMADVTTLQPVLAGSGVELAELIVRLVTNDRRIKRIVEASEESATIVRSHCHSRTISFSRVHDVFPFASPSGVALSMCLQPNFVVSHLSHGTFERRSKCANIFSASFVI